MARARRGRLGPLVTSGISAAAGPFGQLAYFVWRAAAPGRLYDVRVAHNRPSLKRQAIVGLGWQRSWGAEVTARVQQSNVTGRLLDVPPRVELLWIALMVDGMSAFCALPQLEHVIALLNGDLAFVQGSAHCLEFLDAGAAAF